MSRPISGACSKILKAKHNLCNMSFRRGGRRGYRRNRDFEQDANDQYYDGDQHYGRQNHRGHNRGQRHYEEEGGERFSHGGRGRGHRGGRPPGLRGKDIGMYYAQRSKMKKAREEFDQRPKVSLQGREAHIKELLTDIEYMDMQENNEEQKSGATGTSFDEQRPSSSHLRKERTESSRQSRDNTDLEENEHVPDLDGLYKLAQEEQDLILDDWNQEFVEKNGSNVSDDLMLKELQDKSQHPRYQEMMKFRRKLPSFNMREEVISVINSNQVTVISGETGCGKTTQVPQFILDDYIEKGMGSKCHVICTQPRRISAVSVAQRVADERDEPCGKGNSVGYSIRLERQLPRNNGSILFCTTGILIKYLESDPSLIRASHIVVDEIHERDLLSDFLLIILKDLLPQRPDLKVVLMSATLDANAFSRYFHDCPMVNIPGFTFPVTEYKLEDVLEMTRYIPPRAAKKKMRHGKRYKEEREEAELQQWNNDAWCRNLEGYSRQTIQSLKEMNQDLLDLDLIHSLIKHIVLNMEAGAILVFLPGWEQISNLHKILTKDSMFSSAKFRIIPLHSMMPTVNQREVFNRPPLGVTKIVIATNIAETSITIDDIVHVIDCGKIKVKNFLADQNLTTLEAEWVSKANARQRRGRAGRVQPGHCYHLYTSLRELELRNYIPPEMLRTRLEELCLQIKLLKLGKIEPFVSKAMQKPSLESVRQSITLLQNLQALDQEENLLPLGYHLARMPVDPQSGKMILFGAMFGCLDPVCTVAASLSFKDAFFIPLGKEREADAARLRLSDGSQSDHIMLINAFNEWVKAKSRGYNRQFCYDNFLTENTLILLKDMKKQFAELLRDLGFVHSDNPKAHDVNVNSDNLALVKAVICAGLYPNVAKMTNVPRSKHTSPKLALTDGKKIVVHPKSVNVAQKSFSSKWFVYHTLLKTSKIWVHDMTGVSPYPLLFFGGKISTEQQEWKGDIHDVVVVDNWVRFWCPAETAVLVKKLRKQLDKLLEEKITKRGVTNWDKNSKEGALLRAIIDLITMEDMNTGGDQETYEEDYEDY